MTTHTTTLSGGVLVTVVVNDSWKNGFLAFEHDSVEMARQQSVLTVDVNTQNNTFSLKKAFFELVMLSFMRISGGVVIGVVVNN